MYKELRAFPSFKVFTDQQVHDLARLARERSFAEGEVIFHEGEASQGLYVLLEGEFEIVKRIRNQEVVVSRHKPGEFVGEVAFLTDSVQPATARATHPSRFAYFRPALLQQLRGTPVAVLVASMAERLRTVEATVYQQDKLSALGKMAAGLAHELNNPAAAGLRAAQQLSGYLARLQALVLRLNQLGLTASQLAYLNDLQTHLTIHKRENPVSDPLETSDRAEELAVWLEAHYIPRSFELAPVLAEACVEPTELDELEAVLGESLLDEALAWLESTLTILDLLRTVQHSMNRIADLVKAVKGYSFMDQAPLQEVDIHEGLENTLLMFAHRLKNTRLVREYDPNLPKITAYGSDLNLVWTNLIDNALDAMNDEGELRLRTYEADGWVTVEITDNGPGIPEEIQARVFEPFFTTKALGEGTGLGLDIAYRIIAERHNGFMDFTSQPGKTTFRVCLPAGARPAADPEAQAESE